MVQKGVGAAADLELSANVAGDKGFWVLDSVRTKGFRFAPYTGKISSIGVAINLVADANVGVNLTQDFANPEFNVRASSTSTTASAQRWLGGDGGDQLGNVLQRLQQLPAVPLAQRGQGLLRHHRQLLRRGRGILRLRLLRARSDANPTYYLMRANGDEVGILYSLSSDDSLILRQRTSGITRNQLRFYAGGWEQSGYWLGIAFGSASVGSLTDLSRHLDLYGGIWGMNVTSGHLNIVTTGTVQVVHDGAVVALFDALDTGTAGNATVMTLIKGDARYLNASNMNAGTVPVARLPTIPVSKLEDGSNAAVWIADNYALRGAGNVGMYQMLGPPMAIAPATPTPAARSSRRSSGLTPATTT